MTRRQPTEPDPFARCCWPGCTAVPHRSEFFCSVHAVRVPQAITTCLRGAVREGNLRQWRRAVESLRELST